MEIIFTVKRILVVGFLWGAFCFILGYAVNGRIWEIIYKLMGWG